MAALVVALCVALPVALIVALIGAFGCHHRLLRIQTPAFNEGKQIPRQYTCDGENAPPPLNLSSTPAGAKSLAVIVEDPDAPGGTFTHWLVWNLPPDSRGVSGREGTNDFGKRGYSGPCPPPGPAHRYIFRLLALDTSLGLPPSAKRVEFDTAARGHILAEATFMGKYGR